MNMIAKKLMRSTALSPVDPSDVLALLDRNLAELDARDKILLETQISLEKTSSMVASDAHADVAQAEAVLAGVKFIATRERPMAQLEAVIAERKVIKRALELGVSRRHRLLIERGTE